MGGVGLIVRAVGVGWGGGVGLIVRAVGVGWELIVKAKTHIKKTTNKYVSINYRERN